MALFNNLSGDK